MDLYCNNCDLHGSNTSFIFYLILPSTAKEHADPAHPHSKPDYRDRFHFGRVSRAKKPEFL